MFQVAPNMIQALQICFKLPQICFELPQIWLDELKTASYVNNRGKRNMHGNYKNSNHLASTSLSILRSKTDVNLRNC